jgi:hypothetical protein
VSDIFAEIDEELRADRAQQVLRKYGGVLIGAALVVIAAVGGWQAWKAHQASEARRLGGIFLQALDGAAGPAGAARDKAVLELAQVVKEGSPGYRTLARLREAALRFDAGDKDTALALWDQAAADSAADPLLRGLASLMWVWHQIDTGPPDALRARLAPLAAADNAWHPLAQEAQALLDIREGRKDAARALLKQLSQDSTAPDGVRGRASGLLAQLGG